MSSAPETDASESPGAYSSFRHWRNAALLLFFLALVMTGDTKLISEMAKSQAASNRNGSNQSLPLRPGLSPSDHLTANLDGVPLAQIFAIYGELTGRTPGPSGWRESLDDLSGGHLAKWRVITLPQRRSVLSVHADGRWRADELKETLETILQTNGMTVVPQGDKHYRILRGDPGPPL